MEEIILKIFKDSQMVSAVRVWWVKKENEQMEVEEQVVGLYYIDVQRRLKQVVFDVKCDRKCLEGYKEVSDII